MIINKNDKNEMYNSVNMGSVCQLVKVEKLYLSCNQYNNHHTIIKGGIKVVKRSDNRSASWDNFNSEYCNSNDTFITAYCRKVSVFEYENEYFPDENYIDTEYIIMHIIDVDNEWYINKVLSDLECEKENSKMSVFDRTPIFAKESYLDTLEELDFGEEELEENKGF